MTDPVEKRLMTKVTLRLLPFLCVCFMAAFLDRVNVSFAKLSMLSDLGLSQSVYAQGAGIFFIGYFLLEVPSNLILARVGARRWIARIMIGWGVISALMLFVTGQWSFYGLRFLLGAAEAGFFPGIIYYLTLWFPRAYRARAVSLFMLAAVCSFIVGGPLSGALMDHPQFGLRSWQWLFLVEGLPSVLLGLCVLLYLPNGPKEATWLTREERDWLTQRLAREHAETADTVHHGVAQAFTDPKMLQLSAIYFLHVVGGYGLDFFAPTLLAQAFPDLTKTELGWVAAIPPIAALPVMVLFGRSSDARREHRWHVAGAALAYALGLGLLSRSLPPMAIVAALSLCVASRWSLIGPFWGLPTSLLAGTAAAGGIALINAIGNLGGYTGPYIVDAASAGDGSLSGGLLALAGVMLACAVMTALLPKRLELKTKAWTEKPSSDSLAR